MGLGNRGQKRCQNHVYSQRAHGGQLLPPQYSYAALGAKMRVPDHAQGTWQQGEWPGRGQEPSPNWHCIALSLWRCTFPPPSQFYSPMADSFLFLDLKSMSTVSTPLHGSVEAAARLCLLKPAANNATNEQRKISDLALYLLCDLFILNSLNFPFPFFNTSLVAKLRILTHFHAQSHIFQIPREETTRRWTVSLKT